ncbi:MAG: EthD family reductase [Candidatus Acidiferrales bacterium]
MANVKLVVMYPRPKDIDAFEKIYQNEHVPLAVARLEGKTKIVATKVLASPQGTPSFYRIAEIHFPSMADLEACAASDGGKQVLAHAVSISSGGPPIFWVAEEETFTFAQTAGA